MSLMHLWRKIISPNPPAFKLPPRPELPIREAEGLRRTIMQKVSAGFDKTIRQHAKDYEEAKAHVHKTLMSQKEKEAYIAHALKCPNCGAREFDEVCSNAALTLKCDCGLTFNFVPELRHVEIVRDPLAL